MSSNWAKFRGKQIKSVKQVAGIRQTSGQLGTATQCTEKQEIWWDDDKEDGDNQTVPSSSINSHPQVSNLPVASISLSRQVSKSSQDKIGKFIAIDCEMVGIGPEGKESALARVSIVNFNGRVIMDKYVRTMERVTDYRTHVSGITPHHLANGHDFSTIQKEVAEIIKDRIIIGHAIKNDLTALLLEHPRRLIRDTAKFKPFRQLTSGRTPSLRALAEHYLKKQIQSGQHCSVEDARAVLELYKMHKNAWESFVTKRDAKRKPIKKAF